MTIRAKYSGGSGTGVEVVVPLENRYLSVHVKQGGLLPEEIDGVKVSAAFRDSLLEQDDWSRQNQPDDTAKSVDNTKKEG